MIFKIIIFVVAVIFLSLFIRNVVILCGFRKGNTKKTNGYLNTVNHERNVYVGYKHGRFYKHWIRYTYTYKVNGKTFSLSGGSPGKPHNIDRVARVVYQKKNPKYAYVEKYIFPEQITYTILFGLFTIISILIGVLALIDA